MEKKKLTRCAVQRSYDDEDEDDYIEQK